MKKTFLLIFFGLATVFIAQEKVCNYCRQKLTGQYLIVEDKYFHAEHFLCAKCKKQIEGEYVKNNGKFYHANCYSEEFLPKCDVCGLPLDGEYFQDLFGNKYHEKHIKENERCDNCDRLICPKITGGGYNLSDGRSLCNLCFSDAVPSNSVYDFLLTKVINDLRGLGVRVPQNKIKIQAVDKNGLRKAAKSEYNDRLRGFCNIENVERTFGAKTTKNFSATIYVLNKIPSDYVESTIAHELMHVWIDQNTKKNQSSELIEGSCNFISYKYLGNKSSKNKNDIIISMKNDPSAIYGGGFRKVYSRFSDRQVVELLNYLKTNTKI